MHIFKSVVLFILAFISLSEINAQEKPNTVFFELGGNAGLYSINYDRLITENISVRAGFSCVKPNNTFYYELPIMFNYLIGNANSKIELGGGIIFSNEFLSFISSSKNNIGLCGSFTVGYRYQQADGGSFFKIGYTPLFGYGFYYSWVGLSVGTSF